MKIHRDRSNDDVRAAKDSPPLRGWPWKAAGGVEHLGRAAWPALRPSPCQPPSTANPDHLRYGVRTLGVRRILSLLVLIALLAGGGWAAAQTGGGSERTALIVAKRE